jgi:biotin transport system permease protein
VNPLGLYVPGDSPVHRLPAAVKLLLLVALGVASVFLRAPVPVGGAIVIVIACYAVAGLSPVVAIRQVWPMRWILVFILAFQWWVRGWQSAVVVVGVIAVLVMAAALVTLTTRTSALVDVLVSVCRPLRVVGVDPDRVGLVIALAIRSVPIVAGFATQIRDAQRARGARPSPRAYAAPLIVRSLRHADAVGEALAARGLD